MGGAARRADIDLCIGPGRWACKSCSSRSRRRAPGRRSTNLRRLRPACPSQLVNVAAIWNASHSSVERTLMTRLLAALTLAGALLAMPAVMAQEAKAPAKAAAAGPKAGPGQKVCRYKFPDGERRAWVCDKAQPCCAWDAIKYVKCGSTITRCL